MNRSELDALGRELFGLRSTGYGWQAEMARQLNIAERTVNAWGKQNPVPEAIAALLVMLRDSRRLLAAASRFTPPAPQ